MSKVQAAQNPMVYGSDPKVNKPTEEKIAAKTTAKIEENDKIGRPNEDRVDISQKSQTETSVTYERPKALSTDQLKDIKDAIGQRQVEFLQSMMRANIKNQAAQSKSAGGTSPAHDFFKAQIGGAGGYALPALATNPADAQKAISPGGAYSVDAVAGRLVAMAESLAGGDASKLATLRDAVNKGFKAAGLDFERSYGSKLPQISKDTYEETMKRFDELEKKLGKTE